MTYDDAFERLIGHEGGYSNNPADPGGETMYGITKRVAVSFGYTGAMKDLPIATAKDIARRGYWVPAGCDNFSFPIAFQLFDISYNSGPVQAIKILQSAVGANSDGVLGAQTLKAVGNIPVLAVVCLINAAHLEFYTSLGTWLSFGKGWSRRVAANIRFGVLDV